MAKIRTAQQEALRRATKVLEKKRHFSMNSAWMRGSWPTRWAMHTNWKNLRFDMGGITTTWGSVRPNMVLEFQPWPFKLLVFWKSKRIIWLGDREWKKSLRG